jgi:hypothetical protein
MGLLKKKKIRALGARSMQWENKNKALVFFPTEEGNGTTVRAKWKNSLLCKGEKRVQLP